LSKHPTETLYSQPPLAAARKFTYPKDLRRESRQLKTALGHPALVALLAALQIVRDAVQGRRIDVERDGLLAIGQQDAPDRTALLGADPEVMKLAHEGPELLWSEGERDAGVVLARDTEVPQTPLEREVSFERHPSHVLPSCMYACTADFILLNGSAEGNDQASRT